MKVDILVFAAHPDDAELACSGTIMSHIAEGKEVAIVDLTEGELGSRGSAELRYEEAALSKEIMGVKYRENLNLGDGYFEIGAETLNAVIRMIRKYQPEIILCNALHDRHPDHGRGGDLVSRATFLSGLRRIETILDGEIQIEHRPKALYRYIQDRFIQPDIVVDISPYIEKKKEAILAFKSQFFESKAGEPETPISSPAFFEGVIQRCREMGRPAGFEFAEGFSVERFPGVKSLFDLH